jgi:hypothetical protein
LLPTFINCDEAAVDVKGAVAEICKLLEGIDAAEEEQLTAALSACIRMQKGCEEFGYVVGGDLGTRSLGCLKMFCSAEKTLVWCHKRPKACDQDLECLNEKKCGAAAVITKKCRMHLCPDAIKEYRGCKDQGENPRPVFVGIPEVIRLILHELSHCCGGPTDGFDKYPNCNDVVACCLWKVLTDQRDMNCTF